MSENRKVKDSVFVDLFGKDESAPQNFLSLYNALHGTHLTLENTELKPEMLDSVMYMSYANDVAMQINGRIVEELLKNCAVLKQYSELIDLIRYSKEHSEELKIEEPFKWAIQEAKKRDILSDYLERKASEVINMFDMEYDYDTDIAVQREEAMRYGLQQGMQRGLQQGLQKGMQQAYIQTAKSMLNAGLSADLVAKYVNMPLSEISRLQ